MADMVLLKCDIGSKAATVLCPECGRISRQILIAPHSQNSVTELIRPHTCPICETTYQNCSSKQTGIWSAAFVRYNNRPAVYNEAAKADYISKAASKSQPASQTTILLQPEPTAPSEPIRKWYCEVTFPGISGTYSCISDIGRIDTETEVVVFFSAENMQCIGVVKTSRFLTEQEASYPVEEAKHIIRIVTKADLQSIERVSPMAGNSGNTYIQRGSTLQQVAEEKAAENNHKSVSAMEVQAAQSVEAGEDLLSRVTPYSLSAETLEKSTSAIGMPTPVSEEVSILPDENLDRKIERWKRELLDTGKRNQMINYRETKRTTLRILEPEASELFNRLAFSDRPLTFQKPINKDTDLRTYSIIALMETLSYTLNV